MCIIVFYSFYFLKEKSQYTILWTILSILCCCVPIFLFLGAKFGIFDYDVRDILKNKILDILKAFLFSFIVVMIPTFFVITCMITTLKDNRYTHDSLKKTFGMYTLLSFGFTILGTPVLYLVVK